MARYREDRPRPAELLLSRDERLLDTAGFHAQQAVEKALKAFLTARETYFPKIHDIDHLLELCVKHHREFERFVRDARVLTQFAVTNRYPGRVSPSRGTAEQIVATARTLLDYVEKLLASITESRSKPG